MPGEPPGPSAAARLQSKRAREAGYGSPLFTTLEEHNADLEPWEEPLTPITFERAALSAEIDATLPRRRRSFRTGPFTPSPRR